MGADAAALEEALISQTRNSVKPAPMIECETFTLEGKQVLVAQVNPVPLQNRPAHYRGVAYLRQSECLLSRAGATNQSTGKYKC